jgi:hypothetical protein
MSQNCSPTGLTDSRLIDSRSRQDFRLRNSGRHISEDWSLENPKPF